MAPLCSMITLNSFSFSRGDRVDEIMTSKVEEGLRYAYRRCVGSVFSSKVGGFSANGIRRLRLSPKASKYLLLFRSVEFIHIK